MSEASEYFAQIQVAVEAQVQAAITAIGQTNEAVTTLDGSSAALEKQWENLSRRAASLGVAVRAAFADTGNATEMAAPANAASSAYQQLTNKLNAVNAAYREMKVNQASGLPADTEADVANFSPEAQAELLTAYDAVTANAIKDLQAIQTANDKATASALADIDKQSAAYTAMYTKALQEALAMDDQIAAQQNSARYATVPSATRNTANPGDAAAAQDAYAAQETAEYSAQLKAQAEAYNTEVAAAEKAATASDSLSNGSLPRLRYAMYDVSSATGTSGLALTAIGVAIDAVGVKYQQLFAQVARTSTGLSSPQLADLKQQLLDITSAIPESFSAVTEIATMGNQLNIPAADLASFTTTVAKFAATTNVSTDQAATAFGRLGQLLHTTNYEQLGDQISYLGVKSVATESQIIAMAQQLAVATNQAGYTEAQTLALSSVIASLGVSGGQARGTVLRVFADISSAVDAGGQKLNDLAAVSGTTATQFAADWKSNAAGAFDSYVKGLSTSSSSVQDNLASIGVTANRDIQTMGLLAQNYSLLGTANKEVGDAAGYLSTAFKTQTDTVSASLKIVENDFLKLFDSIGEQTDGPAMVALNAIAGIINYINTLMQNPSVAWSAAIAAGLATLLGIALLLVSGGARLAATFLAIQSAGMEAGTQTGVFSTMLDVLTGSFGKNAAAAQAAADAQAELAAAQAKAQATMPGLMGEVDAETAAVEANTAANIENAGAQDVASTSASKLSGAVGKAGLVGAMAALALMTPTIITGIQQWVNTMTGAEQSADTLAAKLSTVAKAAQSVSGQQDLSSLGQSLSIAANPVKTAGGHGSSIGISGAQAYYNQQTTGIATGNGPSLNFFNGGNEANQAASQSGSEIQAYDAALAKLANDGNMKAVQAGIKAFDDDLKDSGLSTKQINSLLTQTNSALGANGSASTAASAAAKKLADAQSSAAAAFKDFLSAEYSQSNATNQLNQDLSSLGGAFVTNGSAIASSGSEIQTVISDIYASSNGSQDAANKLQGFFNELVAGGYASASQLSALEAVINDLTSGKGAKNPKSLDLSSLTTGYNTAAAAAQKTADSSASAAAQVYTLVDYGNDLESVFTRAFNIRFGGQEGLDTITTAWQNLAKQAAQAQTDMAAAQATLDSLASDKSADEYWLNVANMYGDTLRAAQIQADLAQNASDTTNAQSQLTQAQQEGSTALTGNSAAAIQNRAALLGLVQNYQSYISTLAASGESQSQLDSQTATLKQSFIQQATQLGFNINDLGTFADAFDDVTVSINNVPRNITVTANPNPAIQALNEFMAQAKTIVGSGISVPVNTTSPNLGGVNAAQKAEDQLIWKSFLAANGGAFMTASGIAQLKKNFIGLTGITDGFYDGGFTGGASDSSVAGVVHGNEFVFTAQATRNAGVANLGYLHEMLKSGKGFGSSGKSSSAVSYTQLSPTDRQLLMDIRDRVGVTIAPQPLAAAQSASARNANTRRSG